MDFGFCAIGRPGNGQDVEAGRAAQEAVPMQENQGEIGKSALLSTIHGFRRATSIRAFRGTDFDEDDAVAVQSHQVQLSLGTAKVLSEDAIPQALAEKPSSSSLCPRAKPAPPPGFASC
jgi:hypothetical protein